MPDAVVSLGSAGSTLWVSVLAAGTSRPLPDGDRCTSIWRAAPSSVESVGLAGGRRLASAVRRAPSCGSRARAEAEVLVWQLDRERGDER